MFLSLGFEAGATLNVNVRLDSKGIRQAIQENNPIKATNSFAIVDRSPWSDPPVVSFYVSIWIGIRVTVRIAEVTVRATLTAQVGAY